MWMKIPYERPVRRGTYLPARNEATEAISCKNLFLFCPRNSICMVLIRFGACLVDLVSSETIVTNRRLHCQNRISEEYNRLFIVRCRSGKRKG